MSADRPRVGISACLLGEKVRYDGGDKRDPALLDMLGPHVEWVPVCPEVEVGMGTPREPVHLVRLSDSVRMLTTQTRIDYTDAMASWAERRLDDLNHRRISGYILKKNSPSCGKDSVKVFEENGRLSANGRGLFTQALMQRFPGLPIEEEDRLHDPHAIQSFLERVLAYERRAASLPLFTHVDVQRVGRGGEGGAKDAAAIEEPLEIRLHGKPFAVVMRTPGADRELAAGFLFSEGIVTSAGEIGAVERCRHPDRPQFHNVVDVYLLGASAAALETRLEARRNVLSTSSCGVCGRVTIESLRTRATALQATWRMTSDVAASLPQRLRERQSAFDETGGLHAAALFTSDGACHASAEDVGRHNAVDKVVGTMLLAERLPLRMHALAVSGRASFEIIQKAWLAGIGLVCAVSAPSSLAIELANAAGITLLGFVRDGGFNIYSNPARIERGASM